MTWEAVPLGELLVESTELQGPRENLEPLTLTEGRGFVLQRDKFKKRVALENTSTYKVVRRGDIAYNPYLLWAGAIAQNDRWDEAVVSPAYPVFRATGRADSRYLWHMLQSPLAQAKFDAISFGAIPRRRRAAQSDFLRLEVPLPEISEQHRIAAILDRADRSRQRRTRQQTAISEAIREREQQIILDTTATVRFSELLAEPLRNGISPSRAGTVVADVLTLSAITRGKFDAAARKRDTFASPHDPKKLVAGGLHLICRGNGNRDLVGAMSVAPAGLEAVAFPDTMIATRPSNRITSGALLAAWRSESVRDQIERGAKTTNGTYKINQQLLESILVPLPTSDDQRELDRLSHEQSRLSADIDSSLQKLDELFASLQHQAFRGEL